MQLSKSYMWEILRRAKLSYCVCVRESVLLFLFKKNVIAFIY